LGAAVIGGNGKSDGCRERIEARAHEVRARRHVIVDEDSRGRRIRDDLPFAQDDGARHILEGKVHVVCDEQDRPARTVEAADELHELRVVAEVLARGRLIENEDFGLEGERGRDRYALLLAVTEGAHGPGFERGEPARLEGRFHAAAHLFLVEAVGAWPERDLVENERLRDHVARFLKHEAHARADLGDTQVQNVVAEHLDGPRVRLRKTRDRARERRFSSAVVAEDREHLPALHLQVDSPQRVHALVVLIVAVHHVEIAHANGRGGVGPLPRHFLR